MFVFCLLTFSLLERATGNDVSTTLSTWAVARETAEPLCACPENNRSILVENAKKMTEMTKNKTIINKIKHRVTHSNDAIWASICLSFIFVFSAWRPAAAVTHRKPSFWVGRLSRSSAWRPPPAAGLFNQ